jgi:SAM-dependent methyltransferase
MHDENKWINGWLDTKVNDEYLAIKLENFNIIQSYIQRIPKTILDIGCGLAKESEFFQKKYKSDLYLLDGDFNSTTENKRDINYGDVSSFKFYSKIDDLKKSFNDRHMNYTFVDADNISIDDSIKFDLIYSIVSCGFHYPAKTYKDLILKHSNNESIIIMDLRSSSILEQSEDIEIVNILQTSKKSIKAHVRFK